MELQKGAEDSQNNEKSEWLSWGYYTTKTKKYKTEEQNENKRVILDSY